MTVEETRMSDMNIYLQETESIDYSNPIITKQINLLKEKSTSNKYPRKAGIPSKEPLG